MKQLLAHLIRVGMVLLLFSANLSLAGVRWCTLGGADAHDAVSGCCHQTANQDAPASDKGCCCTDLPAHWTDSLSERPSQASSAPVAILSPKVPIHPPLLLNSTPPATVPRVVPQRYLKICALLL